MTSLPEGYNQPDKAAPLNIITTPGVLMNHTAEEVMAGIDALIHQMSQDRYETFLVHKVGNRKLYVSYRTIESGHMFDMKTGETTSFGLAWQAVVTTPWDD